MEKKPEWWTSDHWSTPPETFEKISAEFGPFDLDPCCRHDTAKADHYFTEKDDGLNHIWTGRVFLNPPYSKPAPWLQKAIWATESGAKIVVALLPVRTDTRWFHDLVLGHAELRFLKGRIRWIGWKGTPIPHPKDPSMLAIYREKQEA